MPVRFTSPSLGGQRDEFFKSGEWEIAATVRRLHADEFFVGMQRKQTAAPGAQPIIIDVNSLDLSATYGVTQRLRVTFTVPLSAGRSSNVFPDKLRHELAARGIGDLTAIANLWLMRPEDHPDGNVALGVGIKAPTGNNRVEDDFIAADGTITKRVSDQAVQLGDGGWGIIAEAQAYHRLAWRMNAYAFGSYLVSPREQTSLPSPLAGVFWTVPDVYLARAGIAYALIPSGRASVNLGLRLDGTPQRDLIGGDDGFRRTARTLYADPGAAIRFGRQEVTFSMPFRIQQKFGRSLIHQDRGLSQGGDLARSLMFLGYAVRL